MTGLFRQGVGGVRAEGWSGQLATEHKVAILSICLPRNGCCECLKSQMELELLSNFRELLMRAHGCSHSVTTDCRPCL